MENTRRAFLKKVSAAGLGAAGLAMTGKASAAISEPTPKGTAKKPAGKDDGKLKFGFIGTGSRCHEHINNVLSIPGNKIVAICDIQQGPIDRTLKHIAQFNVPAPKVYKGGEWEFLKMLDNEEFDCVIIASPWEWHTPMAVAAMKAGVPYVGVEVSAANTLEECWDLVNVSETTGSQLNIMENVCYRRDCMAALNMVRQGLFGELLHATCGYEHDLREVKFNDGEHYNYVPGSGDLRMGPTAYAEAQWRTNHSVHRNGDIYPTHGIGPVANCLNINRGNRMLSLVSMASKSAGLHEYLVREKGPDHDASQMHFAQGDVVTTIIKCAGGETICLTLDTTLPRAYSRAFHVQGTKGMYMEDNNSIFLDGKDNAYDFKWREKWDNAKEYRDQYEHPVWQSYLKEGVRGGHDGMDWLVLRAFFESVKNGTPAPLDVYDAAAWMSITALSEQSVAMGGAPVAIPDCTSGQWTSRAPWEP